ncbi:MAG: hypothetical protein KC543_09155 [Myxococcales bacterium]|nr:hypothetical protein [Myxococcales bacterium]
MAYVPARRVRVLAALALPVLVAFASIAADATTRRADDARPARLQLVRALGLPDLVLSSSSSWLRSVSQSTPAAAAQDGPGWLDLDPAGAAIAPPRALFETVARRSERATAAVRAPSGPSPATAAVRAPAAPPPAPAAPARRRERRR